MNNSRRIIFWLTLLAALLAAVFYHFLYASYQAEVNSHRNVLRVRGQTLLDAMKAGILAQGRMGRYRGDKLTIILEELARSQDVLAIALRGPDGELIAAGGRRGEIPKGTRDVHWDADRLAIANRVDFFTAQCHLEAARGHAPGENAEGSFTFKEGYYELIALLDLSEVNRVIRHERMQFSIYAGVSSVTLALGALAVLLLLKRKELGAELARSREHARQEEQAARLGAGLAHETKNPLGIVRGLAQSIVQCSNKDCSSKSRANDIVDEVDRVIGGINSFLELSRPPEARPNRIDLDAFFAGFLPLAQMDAAAAEVGVSYAPCGLSVMADETLLRRALLNLILNALHASKPGQSIRVSAERSGGTLALTVSDDGCGIAPEDLPHVTEPYYTRVPGGSGLGLPIVERIVSAHGWRLRIESVPSHGTRASLDGLTIVEPS
jgi:signal transduction histidine kinase